MSYTIRDGATFATRWLSAMLQTATFGIEDLVGSRVMLLAHQSEVIVRVLGDARCRYMLADEVGLGKTIEACVILKALRRRIRTMRTLIITPSALAGQWQRELSARFWLEVETLSPTMLGHKRHEKSAVCVGALLTTEDLTAYPDLWAYVSTQCWDLLIVDEAHHLRKNQTLYDRIYVLSEQTERLLMLTATPIQRRAGEYLALLRLLEPSRYGTIDEPQFQQILDAQKVLRDTVAYLQPSLTTDLFDRDEFTAMFGDIVAALPDDYKVAQLHQQVVDAEADEVLPCAQQALAYISENYRIERRVIRNRRASLTALLPSRALDLSFSYTPDIYEREALERLYSFVEEYLAAHPEPIATELCRILLHAAASSPHALEWVLSERAKHGTVSPAMVAVSEASLLAAGSPRDELRRVAAVARNAPSAPRESDDLADCLWHVRRWREREDVLLASTRLISLERPSSSRLGQVLRILAQHEENQKVLLFSAWEPTLNILRSHIERLFGRTAVRQFSMGLSDQELEDAVDAFQSAPGEQNESCRVLLSDELGGEGRNFQMASSIVHIDIPWTPAQIEQRIGRVDRLGREGIVPSIVPLARGTVEEALFSIWHGAFHLFERSMSGMEIALEGIQDELAQALRRSVRQGMRELSIPMQEHAAELTRIVEEERYFEEGAINRRLRDQFEALSDRYRDGRLLQEPFLAWAKFVGLGVGRSGPIITFNPAHFNPKSMENGRFIPPNMEVARQHSRNKNNLKIVGTFNRGVAVQREGLVFFTPGDDPWTEAIVTSAIQSDRGRACAVERQAPSLSGTWTGLEFLYSVQIDPRPLLALEEDPTHLYHAQGFLSDVSTIRVLVSADNQIMRTSNPYWHITRPGPEHHDTHLGKRGGSRSPLVQLIEEFPPDVWEDLIRQAYNAAEQHLVQELEFVHEEADGAQAEFQQRLEGWRASSLWAQSHGMPVEDDQIARYGRIYNTLVEGIRNPLIRLESVCFWRIVGGAQ
jgi:ATP-dependent helicase HepA